MKGAVIPKAEIDTLRELLETRHRARLRAGDSFAIDGVVTHGEAVVNLTMSDPNEEDVLHLETRCDVVANDLQNPMDGKHACFDLLDVALATYFESGRAWRPGLDWGAQTTDDIEVWIRGSVRNVKLERAADALLAEAGEL
jgi:hypothetical protein